MRKRTLSVTSVVLLLALLVAVLPTAAVEAPQTDGPTESAPRTSGRLIVELDDVPLAAYRGGPNVMAAGEPRAKLDVSSPEAREYLDFLANKQAAFKMELARAVPQARVDSFRNSDGELRELSYRIAFNGMALRLKNANPATLQRLRKLPGVKAVYADNRYEIDMYASLPLIGASTLWDQVGGQEKAGEGIKVAIIDTGIYAPNPFFDPDGFTYPDGFPKGDTRYTTEKVISARAYFRAWDAPLDGDDTPWPGSNGSSHGTHTGGTVAGNANTPAPGFGVTLSGVAPAAQLMSYRVFYPTASNFSGSAFAAEIVAAIEDAIADGADVISNSWGGYPGSLPWAVPEVKALEAAWDAGIVVVCSAGNDGPSPGSASHTPSGSPKLISVAWSSTSGSYAEGLVDVTGPGEVPEELTGQPFGIALFGPLPTGAFGPYPFVDVATVTENGTNTLCDGEPIVGDLTGKIAVISRGGCFFSDKVWNAQQAGAVAAVVYNNAGDELMNMSAGSHEQDEFTIPAVFVYESFGEALVDWYVTYGDDAQLQIDMEPRPVESTADVMALHSARGPAFSRWIGPDVTAPGVNILSGGYAVGATGTDQHAGFGQVSGSSMSCPHVSGAAAVFRQLYPDWSPDQIKSALMSTAVTEGVFNDVAQTEAASVLDYGAGRIDLSKAFDPGLLFDTPSVSFGTVRPVSAWNGAATIVAASVSEAEETYTICVLADEGLVASTDAESITVAERDSVTFQLLVEAPEGTAPGDYTGNIWLRSGTHEAHIPFWVRIAAPIAEAEVLLIDNDFSYLLGLDDYAAFYTDALDELGMSYDVWEADMYFANPQTIPSAAELAAYKAVIYFTGDNYYPDGSFTVSTPLTELDQFVLGEYLDNGGRIFATGQDLASATDINPYDDPMWDRSRWYHAYLGARYYQDSLFDAGYVGLLPTVPAVMGLPGTPLARQVLDISGSTAITDVVDDEIVIVGWEDGAANQYYVDEIGAGGSLDDPALDTVQPWLVAVGGSPAADGYIAVGRSDEPTLEKPDMRFTYRTAYFGFGFEGINDNTECSTRSKVLDMVMSWLLDEVSVEIAGDAFAQNPYDVVTLEATVIGTDGVSYRWDFGGGSAIQTSTEPSAVHIYGVPGTYEARVEVTDAQGHKAVSEPGRVVVSPQIAVTLEGPSSAGTRAPIRYSMSVTNESTVSLTDMAVEATWAGGAYIEHPKPSSWVIPVLGPGETWTNDEFYLITFSTATGDIETTIAVSHPWVETKTAAATTSIAP